MEAELTGHSVLYVLSKSKRYTTASVAIEAIMWPLSYCDHIRLDYIGRVSFRGRGKGGYYPPPWKS